MKYLLISLIGGTGLVIIQPYIPLYFENYLHLSYQQMALAFSFSRGIAFLLSSDLWVRYVKNRTLYQLQGSINVTSSIFIILLLFAQLQVNSVYVAYFAYGVMLAGCELSWNLSAPYFAKNKESTLHSGINLAMIGIRGCFCPMLGYGLFLEFGALGTFVFAGILFIIALRQSHHSQTQLA